MHWWQLRPTFEIPLVDTRSEAIERLREECQRAQLRNSFTMFGEYGELHLPPTEHRLWSPHLSFYVTEHEDYVIIRGRFAPRLEVWTVVWIIYLTMSFSAFFGLILAYSQWMLSQPVWGLAVAIIGLSAILLCYVIAHIGQQLSVDQMQALRSQLDDILRSAHVDQRPQSLANVLLKA